MKLAIVSVMSGFSWGGSEELWFSLAHHSLSKGHEVFLFTKYWPELPSKIKWLIDKGAKHDYWDSPLEESRPSKIRRVANGLKLMPAKVEEDYFSQRVLSVKPDYVLISQGDTYGATGFPLLLRLINSTIPFFLVSQFTWDFLKPSETVLKKAKDIFRKAKGVFFVSERSKKITKKHLLLEGENFFVVNNPVNISTKQIIPYPSGDQLHFACVARLEVNYKGQDNLIQALGGDKWRNRNWILNFYGTGPDESYLKNLVAYYQLSDKVRFHGHVNSIELIWKSNHILVLPSVGEGTPLSLVEAMICGRTAVVTDVGGNAELIEERKSGFVAEASLPKYIDRALERAWEMQGQWEQMGSNAHHVAINRYSKEAGEEIFELINKLK